MYETILALMLSIAPRTPATRAEPIARAIDHAAESPREAAALVVLSFYETGFGRAGAPFGVVRRRGQPSNLEQAASVAADSLRHAREVCGPSLELRFGYFRTGRCVTDETARRQALATRRLAARADEPGSP